MPVASLWRLADMPAPARFTCPKAVVKD